MCGIFGIIGEKTKSYTDESLKSALNSLSKRGPDDSGILKFNKCVLSQTRLSIVDISGGHQPMKDNEKNIAITFNGEIYNYRELKKELESKRYNFSTNSDTEVILKSYIEYEHKCLDYFDGMFAFAIWDEDAQSLFLARDRFGKKPLYYAFDNSGSLYIASEIKALLAAGIRGEIDYEAIDNYLTLMYIPPWKSVYKNIFTLPPAHSAIFSNGKLTITKYWSLSDKPISVSYEEAKQTIKELFEASVKKRMVADVEIGALLSGGVDSTLVCAYAQKFSSHPLKTFSVGYEGYINELPYAEEASKKISTDHHTLQARSDLTHELEKVIEYMDEPHADSSNFPQHLVSQLAASKVKVALSGDGADELFMGYGWYWKYWNTRKIVRLKNALFSNPFKEYIKFISIFSTSERQNLWKNLDVVNEDIISNALKNLRNNGVQKINLFDLTTYLPGLLLTKVDRTSMMHSLEVRSPFLDYQLAEYVYNLPMKYKMDKKSGKIILKDILSEIMPKEFVYRRKQGFGAPIVAWLKTKRMREFVYEKLGNDARIYEFLKKSEVQRYISEFYEKDNVTAQQKIWSLLCLELWFQKHQK
ncbi:asparagine synthase (glutamine-hydrolyzing) [Candidatus Campbellbacteria bacterium CG10_big_fil_rev_8_21_14_0_10_35_52]|uniref:asparagine synthase (glutamine-hydrolyzing) n=1 Tax=Candidatus Campbellbacteria bacterium CG10_big_fil_rev_8_21_14_0_10_35_52 TaxID=1974527 RepID=A0A2M6WVJ4_9BACT|nr:MAG: asparagine synthase (glutamine-hydrolyzing) [Candidatus Campbellbacteria bacterium CG10_big_fil_rev_8_21_14_0_10_35_52]